MSNDNSNLIAFYNDCITRGYVKPEGDYTLQKMGLLAKQYGFVIHSNDDLIKCFNDGKKLLERKQEEEKRIKAKEEMDRIIQEEDLLYKNQKSMYEISGREKLISIIREELSILEKEYESKRKTGERIYNSLKQSEKNWAVLGGIADGIAGPAAGVATALNAQVENAKIREYNQNLLEESAYLQLMIDMKNAPLKDQIDSLKRELSQAMEAYVSNEKEVLRYLNYDNCSLSVTKTGALRVSLDCWFKKMDSFPKQFLPRIDGTLVMDVIGLHDQKAYGKVYFKLPKYGVSYYSEKVHLEGVDVYNKDLDFSQKYILTFSNESNVWIMESIGKYIKISTESLTQDLMRKKTEIYKTYPDWLQELQVLEEEYKYMSLKNKKDNIKGYEYLKNYENEIKELERKLYDSKGIEKKEILLKLDFYRSEVQTIISEIQNVEWFYSQQCEETYNKILMLSNPQGIVEVRNNE